jgi:hypothetical protein
MARKKKKVEAPPQKLDAPQTVNRDLYIGAMRRLLSNPDFQLLETRWLDKRMGILEDGKKNPTEAGWSVLKGFDLAVMEPRIWARQETAEDQQKKRADELQEQLA